MKKTRIAGMVLGVLALAAGAMGTYAWFTASDSNVAINVKAATIVVESDDLKADINEDGYLPGESIVAKGVVVRNTGSREAVIKITPNVEAKSEGNAVDEALKAALGNPEFTFAEGYDPTNVFQAGQDLYVFLDAKASFGAEEGKEVSISAGISEDLGGQTGQEGQNGEVTFNYTVTAVQGTKAAVAAEFPAVGNAFDSLYK